MNTPAQQAELYRKAAETIELCAKHGIEPMVKVDNILNDLFDINLQSPATLYKFPLEVIEGKLVWEGDEAYYSGRNYFIDKFSFINTFSEHWSLNPPSRKPLCEVEGKPVYAGDTLYVSGIKQIVVAKNSNCDSLQWYGLTFDKRNDLLGMPLEFWSWNPPKRIVKVELLVEDAEHIANSPCYVGRVTEACRKALQGQQK